MAREQLGVVILAPAYYGARHVNLKGNKKIRTPEDLAGVKLRMPGGESWQFLGRAIGANPVPVAYAETYTGLQTGLIDGQDNPLPNNRLMKFHEVTNQTVFDGLKPEQQQLLRSAAEKAIAWSTAEYIKQESDLIDFFKAAGQDVYTPDVEAFRAYAQRQYLQSPLSKAWPAGLLDKINTL
jgi:TRAP-type C4-dicarboxylate transport system substrate-binding protein